MKKINRRDFLKAAGIAAAAGALTACGSAASSTAASTSSAGTSSTAASTAEQITLRVTDWSDSTNAQRTEFHTKFEAENPDIKVEYTMLTIDQFNSTVVTAIAGGDAPDLFPVPTTLNLSTAVKEDWYLPMTDYVSQEFVDSFVDGALAEGVQKKDGVLYTVPEAQNLTNALIFYNKDLLKAAGVEVPKTFDDFRAACKAVTATGKGYGLIEGGAQKNRCEVLLRALCKACGGKISNVSRALTVDSVAPYATDEMFKAVELLQGIVSDGSLHPDTASIDAPTARELFAQGQAAFLCQGLWCIGTWAKDHPELNYGVMAVPKDGANGYTSTEEGSPWMGIYKQTKYPEQAARYLEALYSADYGYQAAVVQSGSYISAVKDITEANMTNDVMKEYYTEAKNCINIPVVTTRDAGFFDFYGTVVGATPALSEIAAGILSGSVPDVKSALQTLSAAETEAWKTACTTLGLDFTELEFANWTAGKAYTEADYKAL